MWRGNTNGWSIPHIAFSLPGLPFLPSIPSKTKMFRPSDAQLSFFRFTGLMDFHKPARTSAECIAHYEAALFGALRLSVAYSAAAKALPMCWTYNTKEEGREIDAFRATTQGRAYRQEQNFYALQRAYAHELAHALWYEKEAARRAAWDAKMAVWTAACDAHSAEQKAFDAANVDAALATLPASVSAEKRACIRAIALYKLLCISRDIARGSAPRRILRGIPPLPCGHLPCPPPPKPSYLTA